VVAGFVVGRCAEREAATRARRVAFAERRKERGRGRKRREPPKALLFFACSFRRALFYVSMVKKRETDGRRVAVGALRSNSYEGRGRRRGRDTRRGASATLVGAATRGRAK
jgi:hypothetical protein